MPNAQYRIKNETQSNKIEAKIKDLGAFELSPSAQSLHQSSQFNQICSVHTSQSKPVLSQEQEW
jgi:hypothetical protein